MSAYYNDNDPFVVAWLRELIKEGLIADGEVDERPIKEVMAGDLRNFAQCHFFAGIGGWSYALRLAGWPDDRPVWTGSCPCQPFSAAGKQGGSDDARHLWPEWDRLIGECRPNAVFGEQVAGAIGFGWIDRVFADLEGKDYSCGAAVLGAHSVNAPHIRQRLYWVAESANIERDGRGDARGRRRESANGCRLGNADSARLARRHGERSNDESQQSAIERAGVDVGGVEHSAGDGRLERRAKPSGRSIASGCSEIGLADTDGGDQGDGDLQRGGQHRQRTQNHWIDSRWLECADGKRRRIPTQQSFFPLVAGLSPGRVGILRGAGNAIVPQVAAAFVEAFMTTG